MKDNLNLKVQMANETIKKTPEAAAAVVEIKRKPKGRKFFWFIFLLTLVGLVYSQYQIYLLKSPTYQKQVAEEQAQATINKVAKIMILPNDTPQVLVLQDVEKIKAAQPFFKDAENGDQVLVYMTTAVIYSPTKNKIVNVGPVTRDTQQVGAQANQDTVSKTAPKSTTTKPATTKAVEKVIVPTQN